MTPLLDQLVAGVTGVLLLTAVLELWRRSLAGSVTLLAVQGLALAGLVALVGVAENDMAVVGLAVLVALLKAGVIPTLITRAAAKVGSVEEKAPRVNPTAGLLWAAALTTLAYLAARPLIGADPTSLRRAVPVALALVLLGFLMLLTRRQALTQLIGFVVLDNGIATLAFLTAGGVPLVVELGVMLDVLLVVLILTVLAGRMRSSFGSTDLDDLRELHD